MWPGERHRYLFAGKRVGVDRTRSDLHPVTDVVADLLRQHSFRNSSCRNVPAKPSTCWVKSRRKIPEDQPHNRWGSSAYWFDLEVRGLVLSSARGRASDAHLSARFADRDVGFRVRDDHRAGDAIVEIIEVGEGGGPLLTLVGVRMP